MTYNQTLQQHNSDIRELINTANNLPTAVLLQEKTVDITTNGSVEIIPDSGYALSKVTTNVNIAGSGGENGVVNSAMGTLTSIDDSSITSLRQYAFAYMDALKTARLSGVTAMPASVFRGCSNLESADLSNVTGTLNAYTFMDCPKLKKHKCFVSDKFFCLTLSKLCRT